MGQEPCGTGSPSPRARKNPGLPGEADHQVEKFFPGTGRTADQVIHDRGGVGHFGVRQQEEFLARLLVLAQGGHQVAVLQEIGVQVGGDPGLERTVGMQGVHRRADVLEQGVEIHLQKARGFFLQIHHGRVEAPLGKVEQGVENPVPPAPQPDAPAGIPPAPLLLVEKPPAVARPGHVVVGIDLQQVAQLLVHHQSADGRFRFPGRCRGSPSG